MIGAFPWDPFPPGEPEPKGPDPVHQGAYHAAVTASDAYRAVRSVFRRENGTLRVGNRFVSETRYREVAFLAFGHAANSMALGALHAVGDRLTQGYLAGPEPVTPELPFRGLRLPPGWPGREAAAPALQAAVEIAEGLDERDLLLVLLSPGAAAGLAAPPKGSTGEEFAEFLDGASAAGASAAELELFVRVLAGGAVGGLLAPHCARVEVATFVVERGNGPSRVGGGPMTPVRPDERVETRAALERLGLLPTLPPTWSARLAPGASGPAVPPTVARPTVVAQPSDALRAAADWAFDRGWSSRLAQLQFREPPGPTAAEFLDQTEAVLAAEGLTPESRTKGVAVFAMATLGVPEGRDDGPALATFLSEAQARVRRREMSVAVYRTGGNLSESRFPAGAVFGPPTSPKARVRPGRARELPMRRGITDVGAVLVALCGLPETTPGARR